MSNQSGEISDAWCAERFCYVSSPRCPGAKKTVFLAALEGSIIGELWYSYAQCGAIDSFEADRSSDFTSSCIGGADAGVNGNGYCAPGIVGPKCEACASPGEYFDDEYTSCVACPSGTTLPPWIITG